jgi:chaperonin GroEL
MAFQTAKAQSAAKRIEVKGAPLEALVLKTMRNIADIVGATLGPGGCPVLIERQEWNLPAMVTKDGVTVMRSLGYQDPVQHSILEASRDAAIRTASEAGDGTTTATVLAYAIVERLQSYCRANPKVSPQRVVRLLERTFRQTIEPLVKSLAVKADLESPRGRALLEAVARVSANGDADLAKAVMECFDLVGDSGNVTIAESSGNSHYEVEHINGFPVGLGLEDCCLRFAPDFINDPGSQRCVMDNPGVLLYHGRVSSFASLVHIMQKVANEFQRGADASLDKFPALLIVATEFSDDALTGLAVNFRDAATMKAFPLAAPRTAEPGAQLQFLEDLQALTGATILDQTGVPLEQAQLLHIGRGVRTLEVGRWRSNVIMRESGVDDPQEVQEMLAAREERVLQREAAVVEQMRGAPSQFTAQLVQERLAKLTGGIARLKVVGASNGELKEKRDRAEDSVCAVRGTIKHGCLPGGCWTLLKVCEELRDLADPILEGTLIPALRMPFEKLLQNSGCVDTDEALAIEAPILKSIREPQVEGNDQGGLQTLVFHPLVYDCLEQKHVDAFQGGILDSTPAVLEALRNALSIASLLGTLGGTVVFNRNRDMELLEARAAAEYGREDNGSNPADDRG